MQVLRSSRAASVNAVGHDSPVGMLLIEVLCASDRLLEENLWIEIV